MKIQIKNYTFNKTTKQVTFTDYTSIDLDSVLLITNVNTNTIIYNFACTGFGGTVSGNVLTLTYNTSSMADTDKLQIFYDDTTINSATSENQDIMISLIETLQELNARLQVLSGMANAGAPALRTIPIASVSTAVTGSLTTVTNLTNFGTGYPAKEVSDDMNNLVVTLANINNAVSA